MTVERHIDALVDAWLDGDCSPEEAQQVEQHVVACPRCRRLVDALTATQVTLRAGHAEEEHPPGLEQGILDRLDAEDATGTVATIHSRPGSVSVGRWWLVAASLAALVGALWVYQHRELPTPAVADLSTFIHQASYGLLEGPLAATVAASESATIEQRWQRAGIAFPVRVLDLSAMGLDVVGGDAMTIAGVPMARSVYQGPDGRLVCWMMRLRMEALPEDFESRTHRDIEFRIYRRGSETLVFWEEGPVLCGLVAAGDPEAVIGLAFAKAMASTPPSEA
jgi:anti-sigma factor RsiW